MFTDKLKMNSIAEAVKKVMNDGMKDEESGLRMAAHAAHREGKKRFFFQGKTYPIKVQGEEVSYGEAIQEDKEEGHEDEAKDKKLCKDIARKEVKRHETERHGKKGDVAQHVKKMHKEETFKDRLIEAAYAKKSPMIDEDESTMTPAQKKKKEKIVLSMKDKEKEFKAKYGKNWKSVMYATATKLAMKEEFDAEDLDEGNNFPRHYDPETDLRSKSSNELEKIRRDLTNHVSKHPEHIAIKRHLDLLNKIRAERIGKKSSMKKEEVEELDEISQPEVDKFHKKLDTLVHSTFGKSSKEKKMKEETEKMEEANLLHVKVGEKVRLTNPKSPASHTVDKIDGQDVHITKNDGKKVVMPLERIKRIKYQAYKLGEDVEQIDEVGDTEKGRQALTRLIGARVQDPKGKHGLQGVKRALKRLGPARRLRGEEVEEQSVAEDSVDPKYPHGNIKHRIVYRRSGEIVKDIPPFDSKSDAQQHAAKDPQYSVQSYRVKQGVAEEIEHIDEKNKSHTHAAHYENDKGEWVGMNLLVAKDDNDAIRQAHEKCKEGCRLSRVERHIPVKEETDPPFTPDKKKPSADVTDKSGAHHTVMSRVRHLARQALEKQRKMKKEMIGKDGMTSEEINEE